MCRTTLTMTKPLSPVENLLNVSKFVSELQVYMFLFFHGSTVSTICYIEHTVNHVFKYPSKPDSDFLSPIQQEHVHLIETCFAKYIL